MSLLTSKMLGSERFSSLLEHLVAWETDFSKMSFASLWELPILPSPANELCQDDVRSFKSTCSSSTVLCSIVISRTAFSLFGPPPVAPWPTNKKSDKLQDIVISTCHPQSAETSLTTVQSRMHHTSQKEPPHPILCSILGHVSIFAEEPAEHKKFRVFAREVGRKHHVRG